MIYCLIDTEGVITVDESLYFSDGYFSGVLLAFKLTLKFL